MSRRSTMIALIALIAVTVAACARSPDRVVEDLAQTAPGEFRFIATASMLHPLNNTQGEQFRLRRLAELLAARALCLGGYDLTSRAPPLGSASRGDEHYLRDIVYTGRCR